MLKNGALVINLRDGTIWGDLEHCPRGDLLESARTLATLVPTVQHRGLWGLGKAYDHDCYILTSNKSYRTTPEGTRLIILHGPKKIEPWFVLVGHLNCQHVGGCLCNTIAAATGEARPS